MVTAEGSRKLQAYLDLFITGVTVSNVTNTFTNTFTTGSLTFTVLTV
jgi:hypothetical protein